jgi:hypothetical protein
MGAKLTDAKYSKILSQTFGSWTPQMSTVSSNKRELVAVHKAIETFLPVLKTNQWWSIKVMTDNTTTAYNINRKAATHKLVPSTRKLLVIAENNDLQVKADYIPGVENGTADSLGRLETAGDYSIQPKKAWSVLRYLQIIPNVDLFANKHNHLLSVYGSLRKDPKNPSNLGNTLDVNWTNMCPFLHPPIPLINKVLEKFKAECQEGVISFRLAQPKMLNSPKRISSQKICPGTSFQGPDQRIKNGEEILQSEKPLCLPSGKLVMYKIRNPTLTPTPPSFQNPLLF